MFLSRVALLSLLAGGAACGVDPVLDAPTARFQLPSGDPDESFFALPWPNDVHRVDGRVDLSRFPNPSDNETVQSYLDIMSTELGGWGLNSAIYFSFTDQVDERTLPRTERDSLTTESTVFVIDVTPGPTLGRVHPIVVSYVDEETIYWPGHTIAMRPVYGIPFRSDHTYAAVVASGVRPVVGGQFQRAGDLSRIVGGDRSGLSEEVSVTYEAALSALADAGVGEEQILNLSVFTTQDAVGELIAFRDWMMESYPEPSTSDFAYVAQENGYTEISGRYGPTPYFQRGPIPFGDAPTGGIGYGPDGAPLVDEEVELRFALTIPDGPIPESGFPLVIYQHGTGGDYRSVVRGGTAETLAREGYALLGFDQILHGERNPTGGSPELAFFNFINPYAARDNNRQSALDVVQQARMARGLEVPARAFARDGEPATFDHDRIYVYGHSQGALNLPLFLGIDDQTRGGVFSGGSGTLALALLEKVEPVNIAAAVRLFLGLPGGTTAAAIEMERFTLEHPIVTLIQTWVDPSDTVNYASLLFDRPREGFAPKSILQTLGLSDDFTTPNSGESFAAACRTPFVEPVARPVLAMELLNVGSVTAPVSGNVGEGQATAGVVHFARGTHFVAGRSEVARRQIRGFFRSFHDGVPTIPSWFDEPSPE